MFYGGRLIYSALEKGENYDRLKKSFYVGYYLVTETDENNECINDTIPIIEDELFANNFDTLKIKVRKWYKNNFKEAEFYVENRLWKWKFFKVTSEDVAFAINLEPHDNYIEIYYGYASTAFTKMTNCENALNEYGVGSDTINIRSMIKFKCRDDEAIIYNKIKNFYDEYNSLTKNELLELAKEKRKEFISKVNSKLKSIGMKKKSSTWTISLNNEYKLSLIMDKTRFCDCYDFYYAIHNIEENIPMKRCHSSYIAYEYKNQRCHLNYQCYSEEELENFLNFIVDGNLLPIIKTNESNLKDLIIKLNQSRKPRLLMPTNEEIKFYDGFVCDLNDCTTCYKNK